MTAKLGFFEIPSEDFDRAVKFYRNVLGFKIEVCPPYEEEQMGMIECENVMGAIFRAKGYKPSPQGTIITFDVEDIDETLQKANKNGGRTEKGKTCIQADGMGWFALLNDSEGNRIGLHSLK